MKYILFLSITFSFIFSDEVIYIDNPYKTYFNKEVNRYSRNIWDMQLYNSKIYIGAGNSSNIGPSSNSGRVAIYSINPKNDKINFEYKVAEEQINIFKVYDKTLYIPGHDATQRWTFGNYYTKKNNVWKKYRNIPDALHVYDIVKDKQKLYAALGLINYEGSVMVSKDGIEWKNYKKYKKRVYSIFMLNNKLLSDKDLVKSNQKMTRIKKLYRSIYFILAKPYNDHQAIPLKFMHITYINNKLIMKDIKIPSQYIPYDILIQNDKIYVLANLKTKNSFEIKVLEYNYKNLNSFKIVASLKYSSFARSFELANNYFYFGIGCYTKNISSACGDIIKVKK